VCEGESFVRFESDKTKGVQEPEAVVKMSFV
jgi:hypothetical protein